ncbi:MAG: glutathione-disulfide reductase [Pseudomonadales bacterium]
MPKYDYDLFVIGGGSGGVRAARLWASEGRRVAIAEDRSWGGTCVNLGCVPKKLFVFASHYSHDFEDAKNYGWDLAGTPAFNWSRLLENKDQEIRRLNSIYIRLLETAGADMLNGRAKIIGANEIEVNERRYSAERILIATGGRPFIPDFPGSDLAISSDEAFHLKTFPQSILIVGGGFIALEFACIYNGLGARVDLVYRRDLFLRGFDLDLREHIADEMRKQGINLRFNEDVKEISPKGDLKQVALKSGEQLDVEQVFYAIGRQPRTDDLWQEELLIKTEADGSIAIDDCFRTSIPSIYALGDVVGKKALTPVATAEAMALLEYFRTGESPKFDYHNIPLAVFTTPNMATVGLSEAEAQEQGFVYHVFETDFKHLKHTLTGRDERVYIKLIVDKPTDRVIGAHMMGPEAGEVIQSVAIAIKARATKADFDQTIGIHPTMAEELVTLRSPRIQTD